MNDEVSRGGQTVRLWVSWLVVGLLLGYGVVQTLITAAKLFTH
ncbi:MFS transporter small subunit [Micromonospora siamensis]|uniref:DUF2474 domain-containing protein n=1 Tax=Micromonospora siamensis TaxID=299152 RepID=A0A1C5IIT0_9ACTN|nr:hypothetical protein [Micromonospora siamensis]SCG58125.1 hypothetical protein GA0074704_3467 [Micromonospora siamensis]